MQFSDRREAEQETLSAWQGGYEGGYTGVSHGGRGNYSSALQSVASAPAHYAGHYGSVPYSEPYVSSAGVLQARLLMLLPAAVCISEARV